MWDQPEDAIRAELGTGERLLWAGRPRLGLMLRPADVFLIPFSLMWGGFAIFWETIAIVGNAPFFFALWGVPFVLVGLYLIVGRFFVDARQRANTFYGVTSERVIIISGLLSRKVKSLSLDSLSDVTLTERSSGSGIVSFGPLPPMYWRYSTGGWPGMGNHVVPCFELPGDARNVYEIVRDAQRAAKEQR
jgi:hypothetical protein